MERSKSTEPQLFHCPTCGASLPVPDAPSVRCEYCGSNVLVPADYRPVKAAEQTPQASPVVEQVSGLNTGLSTEATAPRRTALSGIIGLIILGLVICVVSGGILTATGVFTSAAIFGSAMKEITSTESIVSDPTMIVTAPTAVSTPTQLPSINVDLTFGGDGTGPGKFSDPRYVAVSAQGEIFVADYSDGRIQKFDRDGKFIQLIQVEPDRNDNVLIRSMASDYAGRLWVARGGDLLIYNTADGSPAGSILGQFPGLNHDQVAIDPANRLFVVNTAAGNDGLMQYDPQGNLVWSKEQILQGVAPKNTPASINRIAVDGMGNSFVLNTFSAEIYKFDVQGSFLDRFGSKGENLQQFNSPDAMAIDGQGRLFIFDSGGDYLIKIFDNNGSFLKALPWPDELTFPRMIYFDVNGNLYTVTNTNQVARMTIAEGAIGD